jgi:hypothetical protein
MASTSRKPIKNKNNKSDVRRAMKHRLAVSYVKGKRAGGRRAVRTAMDADD